MKRDYCDFSCLRIIIVVMAAFNAFQLKSRFFQGFGQFVGDMIGSLGIGFNRNCTLDQIIINRHFFSQIYQCFNITFNCLFGH